MFLTLCPYEVDHVIRERDMSIQKGWGREDRRRKRGEKRRGTKKRREENTRRLVEIIGL